MSRKLTNRAGAMINWNVLPTVRVAVIFTRVEDPTGVLARTVNVPEIEPAGIVTLVVENSVNEGEADDSVTTDPPVGAGASNFTVPVDNAVEPPISEAGLRTKLATLGGLILRLANTEFAPNVAVILTVAVAVTD